jgi:hypothetical protein
MRSIPVAARSKAWVCGRALAGIVGSDPTGDMNVCLLWVFVLSGRGLCDGPIPRPEESYRLRCVSEYDKIKNKQHRHLLWVGRRGKDCETKLVISDLCSRHERSFKQDYENNTDFYENQQPTFCLCTAWVWSYVHEYGPMYMSMVLCTAWVWSYVQHEYGPMCDTMELVTLIDKGPLMNWLENFYIQAY